MNGQIICLKEKMSFILGWREYLSRRMRRNERCMCIIDV